MCSANVSFKVVAAPGYGRVVVYSLIVSRIRYALPGWGGFVSAELKCKIDAMFKRLKRYGYTKDNLTSVMLTRTGLTLSDLLDEAASVGVIIVYTRVPPRRMVDNLRVRGHPYNLPECSTNVHKKYFVLRSMCDDIMFDKIIKF